MIKDMKSINVEKVKEMYDLLSLLKKTIDPDAFIAGGAAVELYFGVDFGYDTDIDVFFKYPIFDLDFNMHNITGANTLVALLNNAGYCASEKERETYYYCRNIMNVARASKKSLNKFDFIQYKSSLSRKELLDTFDLDETKISVDIYNSKLILNPTDQFLKAWEVKEINAHYDMLGLGLIDEEQNKKTKLRVEKWTKRKLEIINSHSIK